MFLASCNMLFYLILFAGAVASEEKRTNINDLLDHISEQINRHLRKAGTTSGPFPEIPLSSEIKYSHALFLGADSIGRTGDCWQEIKESEVSYEIHYGFRLFTIMLPHLEVHGKNMSAYASIADNSVRLAFTTNIDQKKCNVTLDEFQVERMREVYLRASRPEYDGLHLDSYFKMVVVPAINSIINSEFDEIEASLQILCKLQGYQGRADLQDVISLFHNDI